MHFHGPLFGLKSNGGGADDGGPWLETGSWGLDNPLCALRVSWKAAFN